MARRVKKVWGDGAVFEYPEGSGIWWAQLAADEQGRRPKRRAKSEAEAYEKLRELNAKREQKVNITVRNPTVAQFLDTWLDDVVKGSGSVKQSTLVSYKQICRLYLVPQIGRVRLEDLTTEQIQRMINELHEATSSLTARNAYARLRSALDVAVQWRYITYNPAFGVKLPKLPGDEPEPPSVEQVRKLLQVVEEHRIGALYHLAILGPRKGEVLGVRWADLDWNKAELKITQQVQYIRRTAPEEQGTLTINSPKSDSSKRILPLPPRLLQRLRQHEQHQQRERGELTWNDHGLIFASEVGTPISPRNLSRHYKDALEDAGVPTAFRFHDLRHFCATTLGEIGIPEHVIGAILGHSKGKNVTRRYTHATLTAMHEAINQLEELVFGGNDESKH